MDKKMEAKAALVEINEFLGKLDPSIRAAAFEILLPLYLLEEQDQRKRTTPPKETKSPKEVEGAPSELADFIVAHDQEKPAENVALLAAWLYSTYGLYPITAKEIKELGDACGLIVPNRPDNTMRQAKNKGKSLFNQQGKGWQPTVSGEIYFKETYKVKKGTKALPKE